MPAFPGLHPQLTAPLTSGDQGLEMVRILEASSESLLRGGSPVQISSLLNGDKLIRPITGRPARLAVSKLTAATVRSPKYIPAVDPKLRIKIQVNGQPGTRQNGNGHQADAQ